MQNHFFLASFKWKPTTDFRQAFFYKNVCYLLLTFMLSSIAISPTVVGQSQTSPSCEDGSEPAHCNDLIQNNGETGVDCGGPCPCSCQALVDHGCEKENPTDPDTPTFTFDFTGNPDGTIQTTSFTREGFCCAGQLENNARCAKFTITTDINTTGLAWAIVSGANPPGAAYLQVSCGERLSFDDVLCLDGVGPHEITFCKPGGNANAVGITSIPKPTFPTLVESRSTCEVSAEVLGLDPNTVSAASTDGGLSVSLSSCGTNCTQITFPGHTVNTTTDFTYQVCGDKTASTSDCVTGPTQVCQDVTFRVYPELTASLGNDVTVCSTSPVSVPLNVATSGGTGTYSYAWSDPTLMGSMPTVTVTGTYTVTVTDDKTIGCKDKVIDDITISSSAAACCAKETTPPDAVCKPSLAVKLDNTGMAVIEVSNIDAGSSDNCQSIGFSLDQNTFDCSDVGTPQTVILTVTETSGTNNLASTCKTTVTVDADGPSASCNAPAPFLDLCLDDTGNLNLLPSDILTSVTAPCAISEIVFSSGQSVFDCTDAGVTTTRLVVRVTDEHGKRTFCASNIRIKETGLVKASCKDIEVSLDATTNANISASDIDNGSTDICSTNPLALTASQTNFKCADVGANTITLTASNGVSSSTCNAVVTVKSKPIIKCNAPSPYLDLCLDATGNLTISVSDILLSVSTPCSSVDLIGFSSGPTVFDCSDIGIVTSVGIFVEDSNQERAFCSSQVRVKGNGVIAASCKDITVCLDETSNANILASDIDNGSSNACGSNPLVLTASQTNFKCVDFGANTVILTASNGITSSTCKSTVTVKSKPIVKCNAPAPHLDLCLDATGNLTLAVSDILLSASTPCSAIKSSGFSSGPTTFDCSDIGVVTRVGIFVEDFKGEKSFCSSQVRVKGNGVIAASCKDITVCLDETSNANTLASDIDNGSSNACGANPLVLTASQTNFKCVDFGANTVILTASNGITSSTCKSTVTVKSKPIVKCNAPAPHLDLCLDATGNLTLAVSDILLSASTPCSAIKSSGFSSGPTVFDCSDIGVVTRVGVFVEDFKGEKSFCSSIVRVKGNGMIAASCKDIAVFLDETSNANILASDIDNGSSNACGSNPLVLTASQTNFKCVDFGANTVILTASNGITSSTCKSTVTVKSKPIVKCNAPAPHLDLCLDATGNLTLAVSDILLSASTPCSAIKSSGFSSGPTTFDCSDIGVVTRVGVFVEDFKGNKGFCSSIVRVKGNGMIAAACKDIAVFLDETSNANILASDIDNGSSNACGANPLVLTASQTNFKCVDFGANTVILTASNGITSSTCKSTVMVKSKPIVKCNAPAPHLDLCLDATGNLTLAVSDILLSASTPCSAIKSSGFSTSPTTFDCSDIGVVTRVGVFVEDFKGNKGFCSSIVRVKGNGMIAASCKDIAVFLDETSNANILASDIDNGSSNACGANPLVLTASQTNFKCVDFGANTVILTASNGITSSTCKSTVTVKSKPIVKCNAPAPYLDLCLDATGNLSLSVSDILLSASTPCSAIKSSGFSTSPTTFDCSDIGVVTRVGVFVEDFKGNKGFCSSIVRVKGNNNLAITCKDITVSLDENAITTITTSDVINGNSNTCGTGNLQLSLDKTAFDCNSVGANNVVLTATNNTGTTSCVAKVTVKSRPIVKCNAPFPYLDLCLDATGNLTLSVSDILESYSTPCSKFKSSGFSTSPTSFDCSDIGVVTRVAVFVEDEDGNKGFCSSIVRVKGNPANLVKAVCKDIVISLDATGNASIQVSDIDNGSSNACGANNLLLDKTSFTCQNVGVNTVVLTAISGGSSAICQAKVTVNDTSQPNATCQDATVVLDAFGQANVVVSDVYVSGTDNCGIVGVDFENLTSSKTTFDCSDIGIHTILVKAKDASNNVGTCKSKVTVKGTSAKVLTAKCKDVTVTLDENGRAGIVASDIDNGSSADCGSLNLAIQPSSSFDCSDIGMQTVVLTATSSTLSDECEAKVTIVDNTAPIVSCKNVTLQIDANGQALLANSDVIQNVEEACHSVTIAIDQTAFNCSTLGTTSVLLTVKEDRTNGLSASCKASITTKVQIDCGNTIEACSPNVTVPQPSIVGNCTGFTFVNDFNGTSDASGTYPLGFTTVNWVGTDGNGNSATCSVIINVKSDLTGTAKNISEGEDNNQGETGPFESNDVQIILQGGIPPFTYLWSKEGKVDFAVSNDKREATVDYSDNAFWGVTITDATCGQLVFGNEHVQDRLDVRLVEKKPATCNTVANQLISNADQGSLTIEVVDGTGPYTYTWANSTDILITETTTDKTHSLTNLLKDYYYLTVTDASNPIQKTTLQFWLPCVNRVGAGNTSGSTRGGRPKTSNIGIADMTLTVQPNPVQLMTSIQFTVPTAGEVKVAIFDLAGKQIEQLFAANVQANELYTVKYNTAKLAAGIYICRLTDKNGISQQQKIVLTK